MKQCNQWGECHCAFAHSHASDVNLPAQFISLINKCFVVNIACQIRPNWRRKIKNKIQKDAILSRENTETFLFKIKTATWAWLHWPLVPFFGGVFCWWAIIHLRDETMGSNLFHCTFLLYCKMAALSSTGKSVELKPAFHIINSVTTIVAMFRSIEKITDWSDHGNRVLIMSSDRDRRYRICYTSTIVISTIVVISWIAVSRVSVRSLRSFLTLPGPYLIWLFNFTLANTRRLYKSRGNVSEWQGLKQSEQLQGM